MYAIDGRTWLPAPPALALCSDALDLWLAHLADLEADLLTPCLSADERERAASYRHLGARDEFVRTRGWLRQILAGYFQTEPSKLRFEVGRHGKPSLVNAEFRRLSFNVSHSHGLALAAIAWDRDVGVDVERFRTNKDLDGLAERYFSANEIATLRTLPDDQRTQAFFLAWTRKEAFIKALGSGMQFPLDAFDVTLTPGEPAALLAVRSATTRLEDWSMLHIDLMSDYVGAVVVNGAIGAVRKWRSLAD